jgi:serine/threonine protein kinase
MPKGTASSLPAGTVIGGTWLLETLLGEGAFGAVYRTTHVANGSLAAVKVISRRDVESAGGSGRVRREAELAARLGHPCSVRVLGSGEDPAGWLFIALELLEGETLEAALDERGPMPPSTVVAIAIDVLAALEEAHTLSVVHRDLKPANLFVARAANGERVKILDFGLAKSTRAGTSAGLTRAGNTVGTPAYMAPEQIRGEAIDGRSDLFSLGVILAELLCGGSPYAAEPPLQIMTERIMGKRVPIPAALDSSPLRWIIEKATENERDKRFANAREMSTALASVKASLAPAPRTSWTMAEEATHAALSGAFATGPTAYRSAVLAVGPTTFLPAAGPTLPSAGSAGPTIAGIGVQPNATVVLAPHAPRKRPPIAALAFGAIALLAVAILVSGIMKGGLSTSASTAAARTAHRSTRKETASDAPPSATSPPLARAASVPFAFAPRIPDAVEKALGPVLVVDVEVDATFAQLLIQNPKAPKELLFYRVLADGSVEAMGRAASEDQEGGSMRDLAFDQIPSMIEDARGRAHVPIERVVGVKARVKEDFLAPFTVYMQAPGKDMHADYDKRGGFKGYHE